jgi:hypothetical protein
MTAGPVPAQSFADEAQIKQLEKECDQWAARIKPDQAVTEDMRQQAHIVPFHGAVTAEYVSGRRTIWLNKNNRVLRATCG